MKPDLAQYLICPDDRRGALHIAEINEERPIESSSSQREIWEGTLVCAECTRTFPVIEGIPRLLPKELQTPDVDERQHYTLKEMRLRDAEAPCYEDLLTPFENVVELPLFPRHLRLNTSSTVLEIGCGTGRLTRWLYRCAARVIAFDIAADSLRILQRSLKPRGRLKVDILQASATHLPIRQQSVDAAASAGVLSHIPHEREMVCEGIAAALKSGGRFAFTVHNLNRRMMAEWPSGKRCGEGVFIKYFRPKELVAEIREILSVERVFPIDCFGQRMAHLDWFGLLIERVFELTQIGLPRAKLLFCVTRAPTRR